ncbi:MAG TPA: PKD domain-containing protein [Pyrinomonadaceae bacterium]|nr:PKD domain-containing protein [Pyrinomonadaceae bacterium]
MFSRAAYLLFATLALFAVASTLPIGSSSHARVFARGQQRPQVPSTSDDVNIQPSRGSGAVIVSVAKSRVRVGELVNFTLSPAKIVTDSRFKVTVDFGDGTRQTTSQVFVTHRYRATGHYKVYASVVSPAVDPDTPDPQTPIPRVTLDARPLTTGPDTPVSFNAQLSSNYPGIKFRFAFGDGTQTDWQAQPSTSHVYRSPGTYLAYVDLGLGTGGSIRQVGGSVRQSIVVNKPDVPPVIPVTPITPDPPDPQPGPVQLSANPTPVQAGKPVTLDAKARSTNSNVRYRFVFGDGSSKDWQESARTTHQYSSKGNYSATVSLGLLRNGRIKTLSSDKQRIQVTTAPPTAAVNFEANPIPATKGQAVSFAAHVISGPPNLRYRFVFGDGSFPTDWQTGSQASYAYNLAGDFPAHVEIGEWANGRVMPLATSNSVVVKITEGAIASASPGPSQGGPYPSPAGSGSPGTQVGSSSPGDGTPPNTVGLPDNWWLYLLLALLLIYVAYQTYRALLAPKTTLHASRDPGDAEVDSTAKGLEINSQVLLNPNVREAQYLVYSDDAIIRSVRRENV